MKGLIRFNQIKSYKLLIRVGGLGGQTTKKRRSLFLFNNNQLTRSILSIRFIIIIKLLIIIKINILLDFLIPYSLFLIPYFLFPYSLFLIPYSLFLIPYFLFLIPYSLRTITQNCFSIPKTNMTFTKSSI